MTDPLPTWLPEKCINPILRPITAIINRTVAEGVIPTSLTCAEVAKLRKTAGMDEHMIRNHHISNLCLLSKLIEEVIGRIMQHHIQVCDLRDGNQITEP